VTLRRVAALFAVLAIAVVALAAVALAAGTSQKREAAQLLRLTDLPRGYETVELLEDHGHVAECEALTEPGDTPPWMLAFVRHYHPRGCMFGFQFVYGEPEAKTNPLLVGTGVLDTKSRAEADAGWRVAPEMIGRLLGDKVPRPAKVAVKVGAATRLLHAHLTIYGLGKNAPVAFLVWRSGNTLAAVMAAGRSFAVDDATVTALAKRQQAHIAKPTRLTAAANYDGEVALGNPALDLPVYWLGRRFKTGGGVREAHLGSSWFVPKPIPERVEGELAEGPLPKLRLTYSNPIDLRLDIWGPAEWSTFAESKTAKAIVSWKCTKTRTLEVPGGTATIYLGYDKNYAHCPSKPPHTATAWVKFGEDTVVVDAPTAPDFIEADSPWGSFRAMETVVKALRLRPQHAGRLKPRGA
jgi:hypothetical protein